MPHLALAEHLQTAVPNMLQHFPRPVSHDDYKDLIEEFFIDVGLTEQLAQSLRRLAAKLAKPFDPVALEHRNKTERDEQNAQVQPLRERFRARNALEFAVYEYVRDRNAASASAFRTS